LIQCWYCKNIRNTSIAFEDLKFNTYEIVSKISKFDLNIKCSRREKTQYI